MPRTFVIVTLVAAAAAGCKSRSQPDPEALPPAVASTAPAPMPVLPRPLASRRPLLPTGSAPTWVVLGAGGAGGSTIPIHRTLAELRAIAPREAMVHPVPSATLPADLQPLVQACE